VLVRGWPVPPQRSWISSAAIEIAVSSGVRAPRSRPIGDRSRASSASVRPASRRRATYRAGYRDGQSCGPITRPCIGVWLDQHLLRAYNYAERSRYARLSSPRPGKVSKRVSRRKRQEE
jgi:hypothetical protein